MSQAGNKIGEPGWHRGTTFRHLYLRGNQQTGHGNREAHFVSPLMHIHSAGKAAFCSLPVLVMLESYTGGKARTAVGPEYVMAKWHQERRHAPDNVDQLG